MRPSAACLSDSPTETQREAVDQLIARVLRRAYREADAGNEITTFGAEL